MTVPDPVSAAGLPPLPAPVRGVVAGAVSRCEVTYRTVPGFRPLALDVHVPETAAERVAAGGAAGVPLVVWVHGGAWLSGDRRRTPAAWPAGWLYDALVAAGLAVATVDYRLSGEAVFPAQIDDVRAAVRYLRAQAPALGIDAGRVGAMGESAGGHLAALVAGTGAGADAPPAGTAAEVGDAFAGPVQAAALLYPPTDFTLPLGGHAMPQAHLLDSPEALLLGGALAARTALAAAASPVTRAHGDAPPMLLQHGAEDAIVPLQQSLRLRDALVDAGATDVVLDVVPGADHCFVGVDPVPPLARAVAFLAARLGA
ncbi:alpha/beta hydrolase fold domain-containing protein [Cellulomonas sp. P22]|uniref:alpha/beta hydrolase fold domain-containing protein n=1 Tax=Cellulomonas sp. P22 TaxID=3373189 RepID=UPI0037BB45F6